MGKLTDKGIKSIIKSEAFGRHSDGGGLYLCVRDSGKPYWALRYTLNGNRKLCTISSYDHTSLAEARIEAGLLRAKIVKEGYDPVAERHRARQAPIQTVNDLADSTPKCITA
jgi:hypothetical protein